MRGSSESCAEASSRAAMQHGERTASPLGQRRERRYHSGAALTSSSISVSVAAWEAEKTAPVEVNANPSKVAVASRTCSSAALLPCTCSWRSLGHVPLAHPLQGGECWSRDSCEGPSTAGGPTGPAECSHSKPCAASTSGDNSAARSRNVNTRMLVAPPSSEKNEAGASASMESMTWPHTPLRQRQGVQRAGIRILE